MMKAILLFLFALSAVGQTTFNNLAVKTNLTLSSVSTSRGLVIDGNSNVVASTATKQQVDKGQMQVPTAADLVALTTNLVDSVVVQTAGRLTAGDGGAAKFYWSASSTASTNRGTVLKLRDSSVGRWIWLGGALIDVRMFGAIPNDDTIDTDQIEEAINIGAAIRTPVFIPQGGYLIDRMLTITNGEVYGVRTEQSRVDPIANSVLIATNWNASAYKSIVKIASLGAGYGAPNVHGIEVIGSRTNTITKRIITGVTDRYTFDISNSYTPDFATGSQTNSWPYLGFVFVFSPAGNFMGSSVISAATNTGSAWRITAKPDVDWYATPSGTGGLLTTNCYIVVSPLATMPDATIRPDPTLVGVAGFEVTGGIGSRLANVATYNTWVGVKFGTAASTTFPFLGNTTVWRTAFAAYAYGPKTFAGASDVIHEGYLFANGFGRGDIEVSVDNDEFGSSTFAFYNLPTTSSYQTLWSDGFVNGMFFDLNGGINIVDCLLDNCWLNGIYTADGQFNNGATKLVSFGSLRIRNTITSGYDLERPDSAAIKIVGTSSPASFFIGSLDIKKTFSSVFANAFDITNTVEHVIQIGRFPLSTGFTNWIPSKSLAPFVLSSEYGYTNRQIGFNQSSSGIVGLAPAITLTANGTNRLIVNSSGMAGYGGNTPSPVFTSGSSSFTTIGGGGTMYGKTDSSGFYIGNRTAGSSGDAGATLMVDPGSGNANVAVQASSGTAQFFGRTSSGTQASPTALSAGTVIAAFTAQPYDGSAYQSAARIAASTAGSTAQSSTNRATRIQFGVTPDGSITRADAVWIGGGATRNVKIAPDGISAEAVQSAALEIDSTTQGVLFPRMTTTQRDAIVSAPSGLVIYNTTVSKLQVRAAGSWVDLH